MFNLHKDELLLSVAGMRKDKIFDAMKRGLDEPDESLQPKGSGDDGRPEVVGKDKPKNNKNSAKEFDEAQQSSESESEVDEPSYNEDFMKKLSVSPELQEAYERRRLYKRLLDKFISSLRIPCYDGLKYYYYWDVIESLARNLFQNLVLEA